MGNQPLTVNLLREMLLETEEQWASPPDVHFKRRQVPPPPSAYIGPDDNLQVQIYTLDSTTGLTLSLRYLDPQGHMHYDTENLDGVPTSTLTAKIYRLTEGWLLGASVTNLGGGLSDQRCFVCMGFQQTLASSRAPHTILAQGYVSNLFSVDWPPVYVRGPAPGGSSLATAYLDSLVDLPPVSPTVYDDEFDAGSFNLGLWTWASQGTSTVTMGKSRAMFTWQGGSGQGRGVYQALPAAPYRFACKMNVDQHGTSYLLTGIGLYESATGKASWMGYYDGNVSHASGTLAGGINGSPTQVAEPTPPEYFAVDRSGTTLTFMYSSSGAQFGIFSTESVTANFTTAPDSVMLIAAAYGSNSLTSYDWFRRLI